MTPEELEERVLAIFATLDELPPEHVRALAFGMEFADGAVCRLARAIGYYASGARRASSRRARLR